MNTIEVDGLWKAYRLGIHRPGTQRIVDAVREAISRAWQGPPQNDSFWALQSVDLKVASGEALAVIGRNGAGKSTLLKILSRITPPTRGSVRYRGRLASLLEIGAGFHGELTGRENVYLNGSILGMRRSEIDRAFDDIVEFSGVERFIDTPVKHYSSGMHMRLAFSVAAHLEGEILLVDEVLAVGDVEFQRKCLRRMGAVTGAGRTVVFVSHDLAAVQRLCSRAVLLDEGRVVCTGDTATVVGTYLAADETSQGEAWSLPAAPADSSSTLLQLVLEGDDGRPRHLFRLFEAWTVRITFQVRRTTRHFMCAFGLVSPHAGPIATQWSHPQDLGPGMYEARYRWESPSLAAGHYVFALGLSSYERPVHFLEDQGHLIVSEVSAATGPVRARSGILLLREELRVTHVGDVQTTDT